MIVALQLIHLGHLLRSSGTFLGHESSSRTDDSATSDSAHISSSSGDDGITKHGKRTNFLSWKSMLLVLASLPPKQLKKLDFLSSGGSSDFGTVSWDDFHGYAEVKKKLRRLLKMAKKDNTLNEECYSNWRKDIFTINETDDIEFKSTVFGGNSDNLLIRPSLTQSLKINSAKITGIVLHGPSGCGKSYLARIIAAEVNDKSWMLDAVLYRVMVYCILFYSILFCFVAFSLIL